MKKILISTCVLFCSGIGLAQQQSIPRPKLVIGLVIDQMRWDYLYRYYDRYAQGGFKRLLRQGFNCQNTYLNYVPSYTGPGHATIYSGAVPAIHGIVGNDWIEASARHYCAQDDSVQSLGGSLSAGKMSPRNMLSTTIGDELRLASNFRSRVFGIALKDRGAIFPAGHLANAAFWFDDSTGNFISSTYYRHRSLPHWLQRFNQRRWADTVLTHDWKTLYDIRTYRQSIADNNEYEQIAKGAKSPTFPHKVVPAQYKQIRSLPAGNTLSLQLAKALIRGESLGQDTETDMLCISLSATDYIGHAYAPNSVEVEDLYLRLDRDIARFLRFLDREIGEGNYILFLTADHGGAHNAQFLQDHQVPAGTLSEGKIAQELNAYLKANFGTDSLVRAVMNYQVFFNEARITQKKIKRSLLQLKSIQFCRQYEGVAQAIDLEELYKSAAPDFLKTMIRNGYYPSRCGSIALVYQPAWYSDGQKGTTHGTWNPYDTHIPLVWYGWGIPSGESFEKTQMTDIAATLAALLHIQVPNGCSGSVIRMGR